MQLEQMQGQTKVTMVSTEMKMKQDLSQQEFVQNVLLKSFELSKPLDETLQSIVNSYFTKKQQEEMQVQQQAQMEQEQAQMEAQQQGEQPQPNEPQ